MTWPNVAGRHGIARRGRAAGKEGPREPARATQSRPERLRVGPSDSEPARATAKGGRSLESLRVAVRDTGLRLAAAAAARPAPLRPAIPCLTRRLGGFQGSEWIRWRGTEAFEQAALPFEQARDGAGRAAAVAASLAVSWWRHSLLSSTCGSRCRSLSHAGHSATRFTQPRGSLSLEGHSHRARRVRRPRL